jgi:hypothetical protein
MKRLVRYAPLLAIGALLLGGCAPTVQATIAVTPLATDVVASPTTASATPQGTLLPLATSLAPTPTVRPGMEATDPTTVSLSPGDPTLVEFFAFW